MLIVLYYHYFNGVQLFGFYCDSDRIVGVLEWKVGYVKSFKRNFGAIFKYWGNCEVAFISPGKF